jgi:acyl-CoA thioester hydrolase
MPFLHKVAVAPQDIDHLGHAGNLVYLRWVQEAAAEHSSSCGLTREAYLARGEAFVVRRHEIDYLRPAFVDDQLVVETRVAEMGRASSLRKTRILRGAEVLATAETDWAYIDLERGRPTRIPDEVKSRFPVEP